ncbi:hypothetical protein BJY22_004831 [Kribbella shirazensis]|uniref:Uncharacterized protein n=1 Tax=Kribbella shirazensis TaxID=1105143 RepID=A0A7X5VDQ4_9ACTN|nr:hypothetical protein [Kribbella shirazensis]
MSGSRSTLIGLAFAPVPLTMFAAVAVGEAG